MSIDPKRVSSIAQAMYGVVQGQNAKYDAVTETTAAKNAANDDLVSTRTAILASVADLSVQDAWTELEIAAAAPMVSEMFNDQGDRKAVAAIATFANDCKRVAHPKVRDNFPSISAMVVDAWEMEALMAKGNDTACTPIRDLFKRRYHAVLGVCKVIIDGAHSMRDADDLIDYCVANDPAMDPAKIAKKIEKLRGELSECLSAFPLGALRDAVAALAGCDKDALILSRLKPNAAAVATPTTVVAPPHPFVARQPRPRPAAKPAPVPNEPAPDTAAALDEAMNDLVPGDEVELAEAAD